MKKLYKTGNECQICIFSKHCNKSPESCKFFNHISITLTERLSRNKDFICNKRLADQKQKIREWLENLNTDKTTSEILKEFEELKL